ncbi:MAG: hypothetical protein KBG64_02575 [Clostridia bacterium]|nr:hypothetical protein [Clostridia bacterium]
MSRRNHNLPFKQKPYHFRLWRLAVLLFIGGLLTLAVSCRLSISLTDTLPDTESSQSESSSLLRTSETRETTHQAATSEQTKTCSFTETTTSATKPAPSSPLPSATPPQTSEVNTPSPKPTSTGKTQTTTTAKPPTTTEESKTTTTKPSATTTAWQTTTTKPSVTTTAKATTTAWQTTTTKPTTEKTTQPQPTTIQPTPTKAEEGDFPVKNYGVFFRDQYGQNSQVTKSEDGGILIDTGSTIYGVVLVRVDHVSPNKNCKVIVTANKGSYQYNIITRGQYVGIPLQLGDGTYTLTIYEQIEKTAYSPLMTHSFSVSLASSLRPFTSSSIMSDFSRGSSCVSKANSLCSQLTSQTAKVDAVYRWITSNIRYDRLLSDQISKDKSMIDTYLPDPDRTYTTKKGICYDYASLMCAMLRSQGIPTRMIKGSTPLGYHAWNEVFFEGKGWVVVADFRWDKVNGSSWVLFDSTWSAAGWSPEKIIGTTHTKQRIY